MKNKDTKKCWVIPHNRLLVEETEVLAVHSESYYETPIGWIQDERVFESKKEANKRLRALLRMKIRHTENAVRNYAKKLNSLTK